MIKHYIRLNAKNQIIKGFSTDFEEPLETDICINEDGQRHFELMGVVNPTLLNTNGTYIYKYIDGKVVETTEDERKAELEATHLPSLKESKILESKEKLEEYLANNPYRFKDGKDYSVTKEKQNLLANAIAVYQLKVAVGDTTAKLTWNSVGETCTEWTIENLTALAIDISVYVYPLVSHQQTLEVQINSCKTIDELEKVVIDYETII